MNSSNRDNAARKDALYRVSEFLEIKKRLLDMRENVRGAIKITDEDIAKTALLAKGFREAYNPLFNAGKGATCTSAGTFELDASIDKLDNLAMNVQLDKEKHMEKEQKQTEQERAEAERVEAEIVYSPMVAEPQEYQYNADAFEARGVDVVK